MASTVTITNRFVQGNRACRNGTITLGTYATNGVTVTAAQLELSQLLDLDVRPSGGYVAAWDKTNSKVKLYDQKDPAASGGADIAAPEVGSVDVSATVFQFKAEGV